MVQGEKKVMGKSLIVFKINTILKLKVIVIYQIARWIGVR
jgi:hypothetical protein